MKNFLIAGMVLSPSPKEIRARCCSTFSSRRSAVARRPRASENCEILQLLGRNSAVTAEEIGHILDITDFIAGRCKRQAIRDNISNIKIKYLGRTRLRHSIQRVF
jgi:hypothetical protein